MAYDMKMPDLATTDSEVTIIRWLVEVGEPVKRGQPLLEIETDKAEMEVECVTNGTLEQVLVQPGDQVSTGQLLALIETKGGTVDVAPARPAAEETASESEIDGSKEKEDAVSPYAGSAQPEETQRSSGSFFARNRQTLQQGQERTGDEASIEPVTQGRAISLSASQRRAAQRMQESKQKAPHFYLQTSANAEPMVARRNATGRKKSVLWDAFLVLAAGRALSRFERMCYRFADDQLVSQETDAVGVAVDIEGELFVASISAPAEKSPEQISDELRETAERLRAGDPSERQLRPATLTISNLGVSNIESFIPIINPPEASILGVGKVAPATVARDGKVVVENRVSLTLSVDHRGTNGRYAADFLSAIVEELESL